MNTAPGPSDVWNIRTNIGPILFNVFIDSQFFKFGSRQLTERHKHATFEFHFITGGSGTISTDSSSQNISPDSFYIIKPGLYHTMEVNTSDPLFRYSFKFEFEISNNQDYNCVVEEIKSFVYILSNVQFYYSENLRHIRHIISEIQSELGQRTMGYYTKVQYLFSLLFISIIREIAAEDKQKVKTPLPRIFRENKISIIDAFFDFNYDYKATAGDLCKLIHISKSQLNRIIKEKYNMTYKQKHMEAQIERVKEMLIKTDLPIRTIAEKIGYTSDGNFTAFVRHLLGVSPKEFRKQNYRK